MEGKGRVTGCDCRVKGSGSVIREDSRVKMSVYSLSLSLSLS